ncbi:flagella assembly protein FlgT middle domain-containing protein [Undibacterium oligocarboniphilum]|uniref:Flagellar assembly protein T middle domain-containing protein n=1 Tax=Undibacterium oligocarboniphilum TaxID=666702 RepID=A0A850QCB8_9BURK|nr:flagella assembly protein FlgT middle domain-containing protein [Undibacterium oligocarboniphilum]MBC3870061.1 hypothetical protein [Undibacterium oligocarboniphilum]NVO78052.1 hypothetical protein [Undibacterium oligocarboniphilum]
MRVLISILFRLLFLLGASGVLVSFSDAAAQTVRVNRGAAITVLLTGFAVNKPAQVQDIDDIAQGLPRALVRRLAQTPSFQIKTTPDLLSLDWQFSQADSKLLAQTAALYHVQYVIAGQVLNAGVHTEPVWLGLREKKHRALQLEIHLYDALAGVLVQRYEFSTSVTGDVQIGREHVFDGAGFQATVYGKAIDGLLDEIAQKMGAKILSLP